LFCEIIKMADQKSLRFIGLAFGTITMAIALIAATVTARTALGGDTPAVAIDAQVR
jgi:hypothetical protein